MPSNTILAERCPSAPDVAEKRRPAHCSGKSYFTAPIVMPSMKCRRMKKDRMSPREVRGGLQPPTPLGAPRARGRPQGAAGGFGLRGRRPPPGGGAEAGILLHAVPEGTGLLRLRSLQELAPVRGGGAG